MLGVYLAGAWRAVGRRPGSNEGMKEDRCLYIMKDSRYSVVFGEES
jgi:hypothetical protein